MGDRTYSDVYCVEVLCSYQLDQGRQEVQTHFAFKYG